MEHDLLTEEECASLVLHYQEDGQAALREAARLGAERERERAARVCDDIADRYEKEVEAMDPIDVSDEEIDRLNAAAYAAEECAEAIRRGEGE